MISCQLIILTIIAIISTWIVSIAYEYLPAAMAAMDTMINSSCLILSFKRFEKYYIKLCGLCRICCETPCVERERKKGEEKEIENVGFTKLKTAPSTVSSEEQEYDKIMPVNVFSGYQHVHLPFSEEEKVPIMESKVSDDDTQLAGAAYVESTENPLSVDMESKTLTSRDPTDATKPSTAYSKTKTDTPSSGGFVAIIQDGGVS